MTKTIATIAAILIALTTMSAAAQADTSTRGFINYSDGTFIISMELDEDTTKNARDTYRVLNDDDLIESELNVMIVQKESIAGTTLTGLGADSATLYAVVSYDDMAPGLLIIAQKNSSVHMMILVGDNLDGNMFATYTRDVMTKGNDKATPPRQYIEIDIDDTDAPLGSGL